MKKVFVNVIENFKEVFKTKHNKIYTNQSVEGCQDLFKICVNHPPDQIIEVGTNYGTSTIAFALAMEALGKDLSTITTIDLSHNFWRDTPEIQEEALKGILSQSLTNIKTVTGDFNSIDIKDLLYDWSNKILIFYDMHDHTGPWSLRLLNEWIPYIKKEGKQGVCLVHDISPVSDDYKVVCDDKSPRSKAKYFGGQTYAGFMECKRLINWANVKKVELTPFSGGIFFRI